MPRKSIYRQPGARTYQLVHRSQRDPLIHDPDAPQHVLKEFERENVRKVSVSLTILSTKFNRRPVLCQGKSRADLENNLSQDEIEMAKSAGQSALYGIYYDDTEYDYTQHLRSVGLQEKGVDSILIEVPASSKPKQKSKEKDFDFIPKEALPSIVEVPHQRMLEAQEAIPSELQGFQPDMNPHLRQTLEALDDDAFIQEGADDHFFSELMESGERDDNQDDFDFDFEEDGADAGTHRKDTEEAADEEGGQDWHVLFAKFKEPARVVDGSVLDGASEHGDTLGQLPSLSVLGAKKRKRKGTSDASGYSMSSSSMFRNEGLTRLDKQFERVRSWWDSSLCFSLNPLQFEKEYASDGSLDDEELENASNISADSEPPLLNVREDFDVVMNEFLQLELVGNKLAPSLEGDTPTDKLGAIRKALVVDDDVTRREALLDRTYLDDTGVPMPVDTGAEKERWDCETILSETLGQAIIV